MDIQVTLGAGKRVDAQVNGFSIQTDQPARNGGEGVAPDPFTLFLASLATCAGFYVSAFCRARGLAAEEVRLVQHSETDPETGRLKDVRIQIVLPPGFPDKYRDAVVRAAGTCKVKKTLADPPTIEVVASHAQEG